MNINELRRELRRRRLSLSHEEQQRAMLAISSAASRLERFKRARRIAAYVGSKGEVDPMPLLHLAYSIGKQCYLPVLHPFLAGRLWFAPWTPDTPMQFNRFNIPEPVFSPGTICKTQWLDLVFTPLLGFDTECHRLGMGGGFYDRTLGRTRKGSHTDSPFLVGLAHDIQRCETLVAEPWDVALNCVITPSHHYQCKQVKKQ